MEMNIEKKYKVVDSVFFNGEIDYLLFRLTELNDVVDYFIILEKSNELSEFEINSKKFDPWKNKIIHIKSELPSEEKTNFMIEKYNLKLNTNNKIVPMKLSQICDLSIFLDSLNLGFDDVILISNIDEIPVLPEPEILQSFLAFEPVVFSQKNFLWDKNFIKQESHLGTLCFQYSHFITNKNISSLFTENKHRDIGLNFTPINYGYKFELFKSIEDSVTHISSTYGHMDFEKVSLIVDDSRTNLVYYDFEKLIKVKTLVSYEGELPKNIDMLKSQKIGRNTPKKHLVVVGIDTYVNGEYNFFDSLSIISRAKNITTEPCKEVLENIKIHYIQVPNVQYYDILINDNTLENFQKMYFLNEIKKILFLQYPLDIDIFEFHIAGSVKSYSWSEIKNNFVYDLLTN